jgi:oxygen-independent coproporphyrinogen-3 oxidase
MQSEHLSTYEVIYEDDTPLFTQLKAGEFDVDEDLSCAMYEELVARATAAGFRQYEVANFAKHKVGQASSLSEKDADRLEACPTLADAEKRTVIPSHACKHNVNYWRGGSFYGLGPSATSYVRGVRTKNWSNTPLYCEQLEKGKRAIESSEELPPLKRAGETAAFGLRMNAGWPFEEFRRTTSFDLRDEWSAEMKQLAERGWAEILPDSFHLTRQGLRFADSAAEMFLR